MYDDDFAGLLSEARNAPYGRQKSAVLERAVELADAQGDLFDAAWARIQLTSAYMHGNEQAKTLAPFAWLKHQLAENPEELPSNAQHNLRWAHKYIAETLIEFPQFSREQIEAFLDDMEQELGVEAASPHAVHAYRNRYYRSIGDRVRAAAAYRAWVTTPRDEFSDCLSCDLQSQVDYLTGEGRDVEAIASAEAVLAGAAPCSEQPAGILSTVTVPFLRTGAADRAVESHRRGYELSRGRRSDVGWLANHLQFCALTGNTGRGLEVLERHLGWLDQPGTPMNEILFAASAVRLLDALTAQGRDDATIHAADRAWTMAELRADLAARADRLAAAFDGRNSTSTVSDLVRSRIGAPALFEALPLGSAA